MNVANVENVQG